MIFVGGLHLLDFGSKTRELNISSVDSWGYQLQNADPDLIASSGFDLVVIDYSRDGTEAEKYSYDEIELIKEAGIIPIAYISIGEAEDYRFYWSEEWYTNPPDWLGNENPDWEGNYAVRYWYREWKNIIFSYIDKIISQGFMGLYLDKVDEFEYWSDPNNGENFYLEERDAALKMINFIIEIAHYARSLVDGDFYIIPQNGERLLDYDNGSLISEINGWGVEDLFYNGTIPNPEEIISERETYFDKILLSGKKVFSVDYVDDNSGYIGENKERIDDYLNRAREKGYIPYAAKSDRMLDELNTIEGVQPKLTLSNLITDESCIYKSAIYNLRKINYNKLKLSYILSYLSNIGASVVERRNL